MIDGKEERLKSLKRNCVTFGSHLLRTIFGSADISGWENLYSFLSLIDTVLFAD
jgi:hypothetical protein